MEKPKKIVQSTEKPVDVNKVKSSDVQIHFGNVKLVELKLLESINKQLAEILVIMRSKEK